ncbi:MAG: DUF1501 domain-containing protein [Archangiaceae bacterium]|nr:DUF1501 domain-containing protein [Archangiaceae bacterium]
MNRTSRRSFLEIASLLSGGLFFKETFLGNAARAAGADPQFLVMAYFGGGWDQLLALDPRDATAAQYQYAAARAAGGSGIYPAYADMLAGDVLMQPAMTATAGTGVQVRGGLTFGPAMPDSLLASSADLAIVRGMSMDTLTHEVGRRYQLTGKFPRGLVANGSSLNTVWTAETAGLGDLPNLAISTESYNETYPAAATAVKVTSAADVRTVLQPQAVSPILKTGSESALQAWEAGSDSCEAHGYDATGLVTAFRASKAQARKMTNSSAAASFNFTFPVPAALTGLYGAFNLNAAPDLLTPRGKAALAAQAMTQGISNVVSIQLANDLDDHFDEAGSQSVQLRDGFDALGRLINYLKATVVPGSTKSYWQCTTLMAFSEFSRTPMINSRDGRDHHLAASMLLGGPGLKTNQVFGATSDKGMNAQKFNFTTGALDATNGALIRPPDVHATLLHSMGLPYDHLSNQSPRLISKLLK